jgi:subtilisin family serine protease
MTRTARVSLVVCILVSVILIGGGAFSASADNLRRIVSFYDPWDRLGYKVSWSLGNGITKIKLVHDLWLINGLAIELPLIGTQLLEDLLKGNPLVEGVYEDTVGMLDERFDWGLMGAIPVEGVDWGGARIDVPAVNQQWPGLQGAGVMVAVLDTGIDGRHSELSPRIVGGYNALRGGGPYYDDNGHGTHMAGIITGAAPRVTILSVKVLDRYGVGYLSDVINGLQWVYDYKNANSSIPLVVNMSIGFTEDSVPLLLAIQGLCISDVIMVAAAGSRGDGDEGGNGEPEDLCDVSETGISYPAAHPGVITVGAIDYYNRVTAYSQSGPQLDVAAPGGSKATGIRILSTDEVGGYGWGSGTSQAVAHVTGAVALALQLDPGLSLPQVRNLLQMTAERVGLINVENMLQKLP